MKVSDFVIKYLEEYGIKHIYMLPGGMSMFLNESLRKSEKIKAVPFMHEQGACIACEADAIYNNSLSVLMTTAGPGILNAINPIASSYIDGNQMLIISGQCKTVDMKKDSGLRQKGVQEVNAVEILKSITKYSVCVDTPLKIVFCLEKAMKELYTGRKGPVYLEIPLDIQNEEIDVEIPKINLNYIPDNVCDLTGLIPLINKSKRPLILAGNGIRQSEALKDFKLLIRDLNVPILLTWKSADFLSDTDELYFGRPGSIATRYSNFILQNADLIICIGTRLDLPSVSYNYKNFSKNAKKVIVDIDSSEVKKLNFDIEFISDAKIFLKSLKENLCKIKINTKEWLTTCKDLKNRYSISFSYMSDKFVNPYNFILNLSEYSKNTDIIIPSSSGSASEMVCQAFRFKEGQRIICSNGLGSMGYAICHSIGASIASTTEKNIICIEGDGSFQMNLSEIELIRRYNLPIKIFIFNNSGYNSIKNTQDKFFDNKNIASTEESGLTLSSVKNITSAYDIEYCRLKNDFEVSSQLGNILNSDHPIICELIIDKNQITVPRVMNSVDKDGKIVSGTLENMYPFMDKRELKNIMKIGENNE